MKKIELLIITLEIIVVIGLTILISLLGIVNNEEEKNNNEQSKTTIIENGITYKTYNAVAYQFVSDAQMSSNYFNQYKTMLINSCEKAYELLDEAYKKEKFSNVNNFKEYIEKNKEHIINSSLKTYSRTNYDNYNLYTIKDQYGNTYIFKETAVMDYTVQLDDYTLENEEFNEKYKKAEDRDRGILNIDKFFKMINMQDFESAYSVLDDNFKQNYFKTQADFENYMKNKTFRYNKVNYKEYSNKITNLYTYKVTLTDITEEKQGEVEFNIVMKLLEGTDFVMSFEVK